MLSSPRAMADDLLATLCTSVNLDTPNTTDALVALSPALSSCRAMPPESGPPESGTKYRTELGLDSPVGISSAAASIFSAQSLPRHSLHRSSQHLFYPRHTTPGTPRLYLLKNTPLLHKILRIKPLKFALTLGAVTSSLVFSMQKNNLQKNNLKNLSPGSTVGGLFYSPYNSPFYRESLALLPTQPYHFSVLDIN